MNLVEQIQGKLSSDTVQQLSSKLGADAAQAEVAVSSAVPALLGGLQQLSTTDAGATALVNALGQVDESVANGLTETVNGGGTSDLIKQGSGLLSSVMGGSGMLSPIIGAVSSFSGLSRGSTSGMMGVLTPLIFASVKQTLGANLNANSVSALLSDQRANIASALPQGLSDQLKDIPGLADGLLADRGVAGLGDGGAENAGDVGDAVSKAVQRTSELTDAQTAASAAVNTAQQTASDATDRVRDAALAGDIAGAAETARDAATNTVADGEQLLGGEATHTIRAAVQDQIADAVASAEDSAGNVIGSARQAAEAATDDARAAAAHLLDSTASRADTMTGIAGAGSATGVNDLNSATPDYSGVDSASSGMTNVNEQPVHSVDTKHPSLAGAADDIRQTLGGAPEANGSAANLADDATTRAADGVRDTLSGVGSAAQTGTQTLTDTAHETSRGIARSGSKLGRTVILGLLIVALVVVVLNFL